MSSLRTYVAASAAAGLLVACGGSSTGGGGGTSGTPMAIEDERGSVGVPPTAAEYCVKLGFMLSGSSCQFPDGTSCEEWAFYRGDCGQPHSYCNQHGGMISSKTVDMGTWTAVYGVCAVNGAQCDESAFIQSGKCP
jgi:putative hemolysin